MSLQLKLFGGLSLVDTETGAVRVTRRHRLAALAILASADGPVPRERMLALLWPDSSDEGGRHSLGQVLYGLRQDLGLVELVGGATDLTLQRGALECDLWSFRRAISALDHAAALDVYAGPFLDGIHLPGADLFERWCDEERAVLARQARGSMEALATGAESRGDAAESVRWWRQLAAADPISSRVALALMRALANTGDRAAAIQHARVHQALVRAELEVDADASVHAFAEELRRSNTASPVVTEPLATVQPDSVAVPSSAAELSSSTDASVAAPSRRARWIIGAVATVAVIAAGSQL
ncbi:MAG: BTAD domain-containing putative transcriptional regulator, partial [bacterium]